MQGARPERHRLRPRPARRVHDRLTGPATPPRCRECACASRTPAASHGLAAERRRRPCAARAGRRGSACSRSASGRPPWCCTSLNGAQAVHRLVDRHGHHRGGHRRARLAGRRAGAGQPDRLAACASPGSRTGCAAPAGSTWRGRYGAGRCRPPSGSGAFADSLYVFSMAALPAVLMLFPDGRPLPGRWAGRCGASRRRCASPGSACPRRRTPADRRPAFANPFTVAAARGRLRVQRRQHPELPRPGAGRDRLAGRALPAGRRRRPPAAGLGGWAGAIVLVETALELLPAVHDRPGGRPARRGAVRRRDRRRHRAPPAARHRAGRQPHAGLRHRQRLLLLALPRRRPAVVAAAAPPAASAARWWGRRWSRWRSRRCAARCSAASTGWSTASRDDPYGVMSSLGRQLERLRARPGPSSASCWTSSPRSLQGCRTPPFRDPAGALLAETGRPRGPVVARPLTYRGEPIGRLLGLPADAGRALRRRRRAAAAPTWPASRARCCTPSGWPPTCRSRAAGWSPPRRRSAAGCAATCTTGSDPSWPR